MGCTFDRQRCFAEELSQLLLVQECIENVEVFAEAPELGHIHHSIVISVGLVVELKYLLQIPQSLFSIAQLILKTHRLLVLVLQRLKGGEAVVRRAYGLLIIGQAVCLNRPTSWISVEVLQIVYGKRFFMVLRICGRGFCIQFFGLIVLLPFLC